MGLIICAANIEHQIQITASANKQQGTSSPSQQMLFSTQGTPSPPTKTKTKTTVQNKQTNKQTNKQRKHDVPLVSASASSLLKSMTNQKHAPRTPPGPQAAPSAPSAPRPGGRERMNFTRRTMRMARVILATRKIRTKRMLVLIGPVE